MQPKLTPATARAARPGDIIRDHEVKGLHLRVTVTKAAWYLSYRTRAGVERRPKLGDFPAMSLSAAREAAKTIKQEVAEGRDPSGAWQQSRAGATVADLCKLYCSDWGPAHLKASTLAHDAGVIQRQIIPGLGRERVADVTSVRIESFLRDVQARRFIPRERREIDGHAETPGARNRARSILSKLFRLAIDRYDLRPAAAGNPVKGTAKAREAGRTRVLEPKELAAVMREVGNLKERAPAAAIAIAVMLLTGCRVGEIAKARGRNVTPEALVLQSHKTDRHIGTKQIPLPPSAASALVEYARAGNFGADDMLFEGCNLRRNWDAVRKAAGCPDVQMRDLRKAWASYALMHGVGLDQIGDIYGHRSTQTTKGYAHLLQTSRQNVVESVASRMLQIAGFSKVEPE